MPRRGSKSKPLKQLKAPTHTGFTQGFPGCGTLSAGSSGDKRQHRKCFSPGNITFAKIPVCAGLAGWDPRAGLITPFSDIKNLINLNDGC